MKKFNKMIKETNKGQCLKDDKKIALLIEVSPHGRNA
jgi:hypothetical protein